MSENINLRRRERPLSQQSKSFSDNITSIIPTCERVINFNFIVFRIKSKSFRISTEHHRSVTCKPSTPLNCRETRWHKWETFNYFASIGGNAIGHVGPSENIFSAEIMAQSVESIGCNTYSKPEQNGWPAIVATCFIKSTCMD
jgi:hypothetical protein